MPGRAGAGSFSRDFCRDELNGQPGESPAPRQAFIMLRAAGGIWVRFREPEYTTASLEGTAC